MTKKYAHFEMVKTETTMVVVDFDDGDYDVTNKDDIGELRTFADYVASNDRDREWINTQIDATPASPEIKDNNGEFGTDEAPRPSEWALRRLRRVLEGHTDRHYQPKHSTLSIELAGAQLKFARCLTVGSDRFLSESVLDLSDLMTADGSMNNADAFSECVERIHDYFEPRWLLEDTKNRIMQAFFLDEGGVRRD